MLRKKLLPIITLILIIFMMFPVSAYANSPKPKPADLTLVFYDLPKGSTVDILTIDMGLKLDDPISTHHSCEPIHRHNEEGYLSLASRCMDISYSLYYKVPIFSNRKPYHILNINFCDKSPSDYKVIVCNPSEKLILSGLLRYEKHSARYFSYTPESLEISDIHYEENASTLQKFVISVTSLVMALLVTLAIESILALSLKLGKIHVILLTNIISNITMNVVLLKLIKGYDMSYLSLLLIMETAAILVEFIVYKLIYKKQHTTLKLLVYTVSANALSCIIYLALYSGVFRYFAI